MKMSSTGGLLSQPRGAGYEHPVHLLGWGVGLAMHVAAFFFENKPIREGEIEREMRHLGGGDSPSA